ncbi:MAG: malate:quinone oxidoreductase [Bacteroidetes bacterium]|nr:malate:quinone oxidoreductase [Bacteroidota bacterium]
MSDTKTQASDVILIGAGVMSATLGVFLKELNPDITITILERLNVLAGESSDAWNNAGTGHSAFCELNYTPQVEDGSIDISKAVKIAESFETSRQFWSYLVEQGFIKSPESFIRSIPHMSFVWGADNVFYLKKRFNALSENVLFEGMAFSDKWAQLEQWMPLIMEGRDPGIEVAATRMEAGTDVNFGALTRSMLTHLQSLPGVTILLSHEVRDLEKQEDGSWNIKVRDFTSDEKKYLQSGFVFIGAGGGSLPLLEKSNIQEAEGFGGFPVSGQWLRCTNDDVIAQHEAKVYGKASVGSPPMSVPHLDTRMIDGKKALLFGPYAGFSTKFLKNGSYWDLATSLELDNLFPMLSAGAHNLPLTKYLIKQASQSDEERFEALLEYFPEANMKDWELVVAGQRVQVIKKDEEEGGILEFGTEIVSSADGSLAALLGASPGASTSVSIMLDVLKKCFKTEMQSEQWQSKLKRMIPSFGQSLKDHPDLCRQTRERTKHILKLYTQNVSETVS